MAKPAWVSLAGNVVFSDGVLTYSPTFWAEGTNFPGQPMVARARSNEWFHQGTIDFNVTFQERYSTCTIVLDESQGVQVGIGSSLKSGPQFAVQRFTGGQWQTLSTSGSADLQDVGIPIPARVIVRGSLIELYIRDVLVVTAVQQVSRSQLTFQFFSSDIVTVSDIHISAIRPKAFIVMEYSTDYDAAYFDVVFPTCKEFGVDAIRSDGIYSTNQVMSDIVQSIKEATVVIADITVNNPNVFWEVGFAHGIDKPTILICENQRKQLPFDLSGFRTLFYENSIAGKSRVVATLSKHLEAIVGPSHE